LGVFDDVVVQVAGVGVEHGHLLLPGPDYIRMAVPHVADIIDPVHIYLAVFAEKVLGFALHDFQGIVIGNRQIAADVRFPECENFLFGPPLSIETGPGKIQDKIRVRTQALPYPPLARPGYAREVA